MSNSKTKKKQDVSVGDGSQWEFLGEPIKTSSKRKTFTKIRVINGDIVTVGDNVLLSADEFTPPYIAQIQSMWEEIKTGDKPNEGFIRAQWYFRPKDVPKSVLSTLPKQRYSNKEVFLSGLKEENDVRSILGKCHVHKEIPNKGTILKTNDFVCLFEYFPAERKLKKIVSDVKEKSPSSSSSSSSSSPPSSSTVFSCAPSTSSQLRTSTNSRDNKPIESTLPSTKTNTSKPLKQAKIIEHGVNIPTKVTAKTPFIPNSLSSSTKTSSSKHLVTFLGSPEFTSEDAADVAPEMFPSSSKKQKSRSIKIVPDIIITADEAEEPKSPHVMLSPRSRTCSQIGSAFQVDIPPMNGEISITNQNDDEVLFERYWIPMSSQFKSSRKMRCDSFMKSEELMIKDGNASSDENHHGYQGIDDSIEAVETLSEVEVVHYLKQARYMHGLKGGDIVKVGDAQIDNSSHPVELSKSSNSQNLLRFRNSTGCHWAVFVKDVVPPKLESMKTDREEVVTFSMENRANDQDEMVEVPSASTTEHSGSIDNGEEVVMSELKSGTYLTDHLTDKLEGGTSPTGGINEPLLGDEEHATSVHTLGSIQVCKALEEVRFVEVMLVSRHGVAKPKRTKVPLSQVLGRFDAAKALRCLYDNGLNVERSLQKWAHLMNAETPMLREWSVEELSILCGGVDKHEDDFSTIAQFLPGKHVNDIAEVYYYFFTMFEKSEVLLHLFRVSETQKEIQTGSKVFGGPRTRLIHQRNQSSNQLNWKSNVDVGVKEVGKTEVNPNRNPEHNPIDNSNDVNKSSFEQVYFSQAEIKNPLKRRALTNSELISTKKTKQQNYSVLNVQDREDGDDAEMRIAYENQEPQVGMHQKDDIDEEGRGEDNEYDNNDDEEEDDDDDDERILASRTFLETAKDTMTASHYEILLETLIAFDSDTISMHNLIETMLDLLRSYPELIPRVQPFLPPNVKHG